MRRKLRGHGRREHAVSYVVGTLFMVVLPVAATAAAYLWVANGFQGVPLVPAHFEARPVDLPGQANAGADADSDPDAIRLRLVEEGASYPLAQVQPYLDGALAPLGAGGRLGTCQPRGLCSTAPGGDAVWEPGETVFLWKGTPTSPEDFRGRHYLRIAVQGSVVFFASLVVPDDAATSPR
jgi:hypothetical protein